MGDARAERRAGQHSRLCPSQRRQRAGRRASSLGLPGRLQEKEGGRSVRDGRDVVRSWHSRHTFAGDGFEKVVNPEGNTRFEQLCWLWNEINSLALSKHPRVVIFERILEDWSYFQHFFSFLAIPKPAWENAREKKENATPSYNLPHYTEWGKELRSIFQKRCGELMKELCYGSPG